MESFPSEMVAAVVTSEEIDLEFLSWIFVSWNTQYFPHIVPKKIVCLTLRCHSLLRNENLELLFRFVQFTASLTSS
ncbi:hypothetical protein TNCT_336091 [Trichonephila clavata]|uniref:Uncharacterized protein n=1 Tax=Trichonephila clavata TaxID=2740835 RepID=A0A8X6K396_TRICU|nr:hypothetical protein TNCT_336091 [Trichonephila clavata]